MIDTILLDMDGTLLPVDNDTFTHAYFKLLCARVAPYGFAPEAFVRGLRSGMRAMIANDGTRTNREAFWDDFAGLYGEHARELEPVCDDFYAKEFNKVKDILGICVDRRPLIDGLRAKGYQLALANNPMLPSVGTRSRLSWIGLRPEDFALVTDYSNCTYCKPNLGYYAEMCAKLGRRPEQCLMVGNSVTDDACAAKLGCKVFLIDDNLEGSLDGLEGVMHGSFDSFCEYAAALPSVKGA